MNNSLLLNSVFTSEQDMDSSRLRRDKSSQSVKKSRKQLEYDAQTLANRISLLQREEGKIWKNLENAKVKAKEIIDHKRRDAEKSRERMFYQQERQEEPQKIPFASALIRKQRDANIHSLKEALKSYKHHEMMIVKRQSEANKMKRQDMEDQALQEKQARMVKVKKQEILATFKRKAFFDDKIKRIKMTQLRREDEEEEVRINKELEIMNLERMEMELVNRIQNTKHIQKQVYGELESIIANTADGTMRSKSTRRNLSVDRHRSQGFITGRDRITDNSMYDDNSILRTQAQDSERYGHSRARNSYDPTLDMRI